LNLKEILDSRLDFIMQMKEKYRTEFNLLDQVYQIARSFSGRTQRDSKDAYRFFKEVLLAAIVRTSNRIESISALLMIGNPVEAALILRSILEDTINLSYIEKDPILRSLLYLRYGSQERIRIMKRGAETATDPSTKKQRADKADYFARELQLYDSDIKVICPQFKAPKGKNWSGLTIRAMAQAVDFADEYEVIYSDLSNLSHSASPSSHEYLMFDEMKGFIPVCYPSEHSIQLLAISSRSPLLGTLWRFLTSSTEPSNVEKSARSLGSGSDCRQFLSWMSFIPPSQVEPDSLFSRRSGGTRSTSFRTTPWSPPYQGGDKRGG
jgi:hypothetical protein